VGNAHPIPAYLPNCTTTVGIKYKRFIEDNMTEIWNSLENTWKAHKGKIIAAGTIVVGVVTFLTNLVEIFNFMGIDITRNTPTPTVTITPTTTVTNTPYPTLTATPSNTPNPSATPISFTELEIPEAVSIGSIATASIQTASGTICFLNYYTPSGDKSDAEGVGQTQANSLGVCSWSWRISPGTKLGEGELEIIVHDTVKMFNIEITR
jgi:hypothetical protein